jgi:tRNA (mo5U34)-methyltransferase
MTQSLQERIAAVPYWYHRIALPGGVTTPGWAPINPAIYHVPARLDGQRVLDVGAWDGYWSFEALKRGARQVLAIDDFSDGIQDSKPVARGAKWATFDLCREALGHDVSVCDRRERSVYDVSPEVLGTFDTVFFFGTLYHLRHPLLALDKLASVCGGWIFVESAILDDFSPYRGGLGQGYPGGQHVMEFYPDAQYGDNHTNWWVPTLHTLGQLVRAAGFTDVLAWKLTDAPKQAGQCRGFAAGRKPNAPPIPGLTPGP